jgi:quercetin dioxygenase-like cupin family protein
MAKPVRRVVTGVDVNGRSTVIIDETSGPNAHNVVTGAGRSMTHVWRGPVGPTALDRDDDPTLTSLEVLPPRDGVTFRVIEIGPDREVDSATLLSFFTERGGAGYDHASDGPPGSHKTPTIDLLVVLEGEITLILEAREVTLRAGDCLVQRGTVHAWANRTDAPCRCAIVLVDARSGVT